MLDSGGLFYFLAPGDTYDLVTRQFTRPGSMAKPAGAWSFARGPRDLQKLVSRGDDIS